MSGRVRIVRAPAPAIAGALALLAPAAVHACAVCSVLNDDRNRRAFVDTTVFLSLLPLGLIAWGLVWIARKAKATLASEFRESDEDLPVVAADRASS